MRDTHLGKSKLPSSTCTSWALSFFKTFLLRRRSRCNHFSVYSSVAFSIVTSPCKRHYDLVPELFRHPMKKPPHCPTRPPRPVPVTTRLLPVPVSLLFWTFHINLGVFWPPELQFPHLLVGVKPPSSGLRGGRPGRVQSRPLPGTGQALAGRGPIVEGDPAGWGARSWLKGFTCRAVTEGWFGTSPLWPHVDVVSLLGLLRGSSGFAGDSADEVSCHITTEFIQEVPRVSGTKQSF